MGGRSAGGGPVKLLIAAFVLAVGGAALAVYAGNWLASEGMREGAEFDER